MNLKGIFALTAFLLIVFSAKSQLYYDYYYFIVQIAPNYTSVTNFYEGRYTKDGFKDVVPMSKRIFFLKASGLMESKANYKNQNFFLKFAGYDIATGETDDPTNAYKHMVQYFPRGMHFCERPETRLLFDTLYIYCFDNYIDSLWKLRFAKYPIVTLRSPKPEKGWARNKKSPYIPSSAQKKELAAVGVDTTNYVIVGDDIFRLLKLLKDSLWVQQYKSLGDVVK